MRNLYLFLTVAGFVGAYYFVVQFTLEHGVNLSLFLQQWFATPGAAMLAVDVVLASTVFWIWAYGETQRLALKHFWVYVVATLLVGLSFALPLFLYVRAGHLKQ